MLQKIRNIFFPPLDWGKFNVSYHVEIGNHYEKPIFIQSVDSSEGRKWVVVMRGWVLGDNKHWYPKEMPKNGSHSCFFETKEDALSTLKDHLSGQKHTLFKDKESQTNGH